MPWNECKPMDERLRFIARLLEGEKMAPLWREFGISRVTGYKIYNRYKDSGLDASTTAAEKRKKRRRYKAKGTPLIGANAPNGLWCADYQGEFMLGNREYCYPLTIRDYRSRYLIACEGVPSTRSDFAFSISREPSRTSACRKPYALTTACPSLPATHCSVYQSCLYGGCASVSTSSASSPATPSRTVVTSACI